MADDFTERYAGLLTGSYDCVDRIVLNAYFSIGHNLGGFRGRWRRLHGGGDDQPDNTHLTRIAGRFARLLDRVLDRTRSRLDIPMLRTIFGLKTRPHQNRVSGPPAQEVVIGKLSTAWHFAIRGYKLAAQSY